MSGKWYVRITAHSLFTVDDIDWTRRHEWSISRPSPCPASMAHLQPGVYYLSKTAKFGRNEIHVVSDDPKLATSMAMEYVEREQQILAYVNKALYDHMRNMITGQIVSMEVPKELQ